ncbi:MAG: M23 family metallopeptidase [Archangium sp.]|nr:M23 family metallopeptidase [Archangium sp.]
MPTLGEQPKQTPVIPIAITAVLVGCITGGIYWVRSRPAEVETPPVVAAAPAEPANAPASPETPPAPGAPVAAVAPTQNAAAPIAPVVTAPPGLKSFTVNINGPLETAIVTSEGKETGTALTQVVNRSLVWWVRVPNDLVKGDTLSVIYETRDGQEPLVHAVRFTSGKLGKTVETYRFKASAEQFARYYQGDGSELEERLVDGPLDSWEQVTSLLRDGRKHKGVDFKTPSGTPVKATFDGVVVRKNWNFRGNGNSVELQEIGGKGRTALFLHLSEVPKSLEAGQKVKKGQEIARSGNTGRSFAPHLHYQLMSGEKVVDPFDSHQTTRISLAATEKPAFEKRKSELNALFPPDSQPPTFGSR